MSSRDQFWPHRGYSISYSVQQHAYCPPLKDKVLVQSSSSKFNHVVTIITGLLNMFSGVVNPCTGKLEWVPRDADVTSETADISHELARSQYGDMLLDKQRVCGLCLGLITAHTCGEFG